MSAAPEPTPLQPPRRKQALQERVAGAIVEAAARVLALGGEQASMNDVAAAAGVARATLYRYFPSRQALLDELGRVAADEAGSRLASARIEEVAAKPSNSVTPVLQGVSCTQAGVPVACPTLTATLSGFQAIGDQLFAKVTVTATNGAQTASQTVLLLVPSVQGTCQILHLELGPIDLNLLGLIVHVDKIVVDITAQSGPGNLLGNLLCGLANALNGGASATTIANILNQILAVLRL